MKKVITILLTFVIISTIFIGCSSKPDNVSQQMYDYGVEALNIVDEYLKGDITISTAESELSVIKEKSSIVTNDATRVGTDKSKDILVGSAIDSLYFEISTGNLLDNISKEDVQEKRDKLVEYLNK